MTKAEFMESYYTVFAPLHAAMMTAERDKLAEELVNEAQAHWFELEQAQQQAQ